MQLLVYSHSLPTKVTTWTWTFTPSMNSLTHFCAGPSVCHRSSWTLQKKIKESILSTQAQTQVQAEQHWSALSNIQIGSQVFIKAEFFHTTCPSKKLSEKCLGLFEVIAKPSSYSFTLKLPNSMCTVHSVFHISMLEPTIVKSWAQGTNSTQQ